MAACTPTPTQTLFTTSTYSTISISTSIYNEVDTITSTNTVLSTRCDPIVGTGTVSCLPTTITSTSLVLVTTTIPRTSTRTVPVEVPQTNAYQTLFSPCPDSPDPVPPSTTDVSTSTGSTVIVTRYSTYTDSNGIHTTSQTSTTTGSLSPSDGGAKSSSNLPAIIGSVVGAVVGILAIIALVWYLLWRRQQVKYLFDDDDDGVPPVGVVGGKGVPGGNTALLARNGRRGRSVNLDDEIKGPDVHPYQYGLVGGTPSPQGSPAFHSRNSTAGYSHQRNTSRDALMAGGPNSPPISPRHLDALLPVGQRRTSQYTGSSGPPDSIMMTNQTPVGIANNGNYNNMGPGVGARVSDERDVPQWMGHHPRPSSSLLEAPVAYPPGHGGFYQQYGPIDNQPQQSHQQQQLLQQQPMSPPAHMGAGAGYAVYSEVHKPPLEPRSAAAAYNRPGPAPVSVPPPAHQALYAATGLGLGGVGNDRADPMIAQPPPGAGGAARQYSIGPAATSSNNAALPPAGGAGGTGGSRPRESDLFSAVMASADHAAGTTSPPPADVGFGRQRRSGEKSPRAEAARSSVIQHQDGGRAVVGSSGTAEAGGGDAPPPAYSDP